MMALSPCIASRRTLKKSTKGSLKKYTKAAQNSGRSEVPSFKSADISKKAHNGAANPLSMEHFVLKGCFTTRLFSPCQDHRNPQDTRAEKCQHCTKRLQGGREAFKHLLREKPPGLFPVLVQECCYSTSDGIIPWAHAFAALILLWFS